MGGVKGGSFDYSLWRVFYQSFCFYFLFFFRISRFFLFFVGFVEATQFSTMRFEPLIFAALAATVAHGHGTPPYIQVCIKKTLSCLFWVMEVAPFSSVLGAGGVLW